MEYEIYRYSDYNEKIKIIKRNFKILHKICTGREINRYNIIFRKNKCFLLQTPYIYLPFALKGNYIDIPFYDTDPNSILLETFINSISKFLLNKIKRTENVPYTFHRNIQECLSIYDKKMKIPLWSNVSIFNSNNQVIDKTELKSRCACKFLISPFYIWNSEDKLGVYWIIVQVKLLSQLEPSLFTENLIEETEKVAFKDHIEWKKYFTMKRCGVPLEAIYQKMKFDAISEKEMSVIENDGSAFCNGCKYCLDIVKDSGIGTMIQNSGALSSVPIPPPPPMAPNLLAPPPMAPNLMGNIGNAIDTGNSRGLLLSEIKLGTKLKKVDINSNKKEKKKRNSENEPPSLEEIVTGLNTLKKTGIKLI